MLFGSKFKRTDKNVIAYTTHKAGSMVLHRVLSQICEINRIRYYSPNATGKNAMPFDAMFAGKEFIARRNGCFGPIRFFVPTAALDESGIILHLRDPRDVLTSMFFSYCFMHAGEIPPDTGYRREVAQAGIDKFVLDMVDENFDRYRGDYGIGSRYKKYVGNVHDRYASYLNEVVGRPNAVLASYEEMVIDFSGWLRRVLSAFALVDGAVNATFDSVVQQHAESVKATDEDIWSHKRKVTPGDHKEKLRPDTIARLNDRFSEVLVALGYAGEAYERDGIPRPRVDRFKKTQG